VRGSWIPLARIEFMLQFFYCNFVLAYGGKKLNLVFHQLYGGALGKPLEKLTII